MGRRRFGGRKSIGASVDEIYALHRIQKWLDTPTDDLSEICRKYEVVADIEKELKRRR